MVTVWTPSTSSKRTLHFTLAPPAPPAPLPKQLSIPPYPTGLARLTGPMITAKSPADATPVRWVWRLGSLPNSRHPHGLPPRTPLAELRAEAAWAFLVVPGEDLRFILKTLWSDDLCTDLAAATAQYRADTRNRVTDKAPRERREGRRDLSRLERASSRCRANLEALTPGLRKKIIVGVGPYLGSSVGTWMAGLTH